MPFSTSTMVWCHLLRICSIFHLLLSFSCQAHAIVEEESRSSSSSSSSSSSLLTQKVFHQINDSLYNHIKRSDFPSDFLFGASSSAPQIEGAAREGGRGPSIWDYFVEKYPERVLDRNSMDVTIDSYHRYKEDVKALKMLGIDSYRFSISWTRILPDGTLNGGINTEGIEFYNNLIDELVQNGIIPFVTLLHFDSPQALQDKYGGFLSHSIVDDFRNYSELCFMAFGDRVKHWTTINEPYVTVESGYDEGIGAPVRCSQEVGSCKAGNSSTEPYIVSHNLLLAHATVARLYKDKYQPIQGGEIGITLEGHYYEPYSDSKDDKAAQKRSIDFSVGWYVEPLVFGDYPKSMRRLVKDRLPRFSEDEKKLVKGSFDFIGINYYTTKYVKHLPIRRNASPISASDDSFTIATVYKDGIPIGIPTGENGHECIYPLGLQKFLEYMKKNYQNPKIYICENGISEKRNDSIPLDAALKDEHRIMFIIHHLQRIHKAMRNGANVKGYFYWSAFDDYEWLRGLTIRFGLYYIDYNDNLKRIPKMSAKWFHDFLKQKQQDAKSQ